MKDDIFPMLHAKGFVRQGIYSPLFGRNYPTFTATHLPKEFHLLMMLAMMVPSCFCESIF
jgi:hypothetical protein